MKNLIAAIKRETKQAKAKAREFLKNGTETNRDHAIERELTPGKLKRYHDGKITRAEAVKIVLEKEFDQIDAREHADIRMVENAAAAPLPEEINISVEWSRNRVWGWNPHATVTIFCKNHCERQEGSASGCGYDKESAAIAHALNKSNAIKRILYENENRTLNKNKNASRRDRLGYGSGYGVLPYFEGGVGVESFRTIFEKCGYKWESCGSGKTFDCYTVRKIEK